MLSNRLQASKIDAMVWWFWFCSRSESTWGSCLHPSSHQTPTLGNPQTARTNDQEITQEQEQRRSPVASESRDPKQPQKHNHLKTLKICTEKLGEVSQACHPRTWEAQDGEDLKVQGHPSLHWKFQANVATEDPVSDQTHTPA